MHLLLLRIQLFSFSDHQRYIFLTETFFRCLFESIVQYDKKYCINMQCIHNIKTHCWISTVS